MRKYEVMYIVNSSLDEEKRQSTIDQLHEIVTKDEGTVLKVNEWGTREFAYEIDHMTKGYYVVVEFSAKPETMKEFDRVSGLNNNVVRHLIINLEDK